MDGRQPSATGPLNPLRPNQRRRPAPSSNNPLVARKKPRSQQPRPANTASQSAPLPAVAKLPGRPKQSVEELRKQYNGWSEPPPPHPYVDYPLFTTPKELKQGIRFHVMRLTALPDKADKAAPQDQPKKIDPTNPNEFTRPVTLHRRDPRQPPIGRTIKEEDKPSAIPMDEGDAERMAQQKAEREAQRAIDMAQIAPVAKDPNANKKTAKKNPKADKVNPVFQRPDESFKKEADLHYEESLPWHLEDADGKNVWVGSYVGPLSETNVAFVIQDSNFRMIPLEKFYKFKAKPPFTPFSIEQAEQILNKKAEVGRWAMIDDEKKQREEEALEFRKYLSGGVKVKTESASFKNSSRSEKLDHDELDMSDNEFQDDDEKPSLERDNDEDFLEAQNKIRRNMLGANLFGEGDEHEVERQEEEEAEEELARKVAGDTIRKKLIKQEKETVYATDSDDDPFKSSSEDEAENEADKDKAKEEDSKNGKNSQGGPLAAKGNTGASSKQKLPDNAKKGKSLKRPGSPNLSESSSNESSRKKVKKGNSSVQPSRSSTPVPGSQGARDSDLATGEMSDNAPARSQLGASRSGPSGGSRAASPASPPASGAAGSSSGIIQPADIAAVIPLPPNGISIGNLLQHFQRRVGSGPDQVAKPAFISMVRSVAVFGPDKLLRRRT